MWETFSAAEKGLARRLLEEDHLTFTRFFFREVQGMPFRVGPHHAVIGRALDDVIAGKIPRLLITVPPGYTKTEEAVIAFIARGMALTKGRARFIHTSFSGELVNENSVRTKDIMGSEPYAAMWGIEFREEASGKGRWLTPQGGGLLAKPAGGPITGFRAGLMEEGSFTGALVIDDPLKPDDVFTIKRERINQRWHSTFKSRLAIETIPVVVIMQRLHVNDFAGYLLAGHAGCKWHHLYLPVMIDNSAPYPSEFTHGIPIAHGLPDGPLWEAKHSRAQIEELAAGDAYTFAAQYMQRPISVGGNVFKEAWLAENAYEELPDLGYRFMTADTAQKVEERHDYSVIQCWGVGLLDGDAYLVDQVRGKFEAPELLAVAKAFWEKHAAQPVNRFGVLRHMGIEDKVSGTGLIQQLSAGGSIPVRPIERGAGRNKFQRAQDVVAYWAAGRVHIPTPDIAPWVTEWAREVLAFTGTQGDGHDDQVDPMIDAVREALGGGINYRGWV